MTPFRVIADGHKLSWHMFRNVPFFSVSVPGSVVLVASKVMGDTGSSFPRQFKQLVFQAVISQFISHKVSSFAGCHLFASCIITRLTRI